MEHAGLDKVAGAGHSAGVLDSLYPMVRAGLFRLDPEVAHHLSLSVLRLAERVGLLRLAYPADELVAPVEVLGLRFPNRIGLAAGMDKAGDTIDGFGRLGFGSLEIGTFTPRAQPGNPKPRLFRLVEHEAGQCSAGRLVAWDRKTGKSIEPKFKPSRGLI